MFQFYPIKLIVDQYLIENPTTSLDIYLINVVPEAAFLNPLLTAVVCMIVVPVINGVINKINTKINKFIKL